MVDSIIDDLCRRLSNCKSTLDARINPRIFALLMRFGEKMIRSGKIAPFVAAGGPPETQVSRAEVAIQQAILTLGLPPDTRLVLPMLAQRYGYGPTPLREALSRLSAKGLVEAVDNRGFRVAGMSVEDLRDVTTARVVVETGALRLAMEDRVGAWQDDLIAAMHRFSREANANPDLNNNDAFEAAHKALHTAIIAGCACRRLISQQESLYDAAARYRRNVSQAFGNAEDVVAMHQALVDLVLGADVTAACSALTTHLERTLHEVYPESVLV
jgi:DNA-binding GntR family transcriptional regulator